MEQLKHFVFPLPSFWGLLFVLKAGYNKNNVATVKRIRQLYPEWQPIKVRRLVNFNWPLICNRVPVEFKTSIVCAISLYRYIKATQTFRSAYNIGLFKPIFIDIGSTSSSFKWKLVPDALVATPPHQPLSWEGGGLELNLS